MENRNPENKLQSYEIGSFWESLLYGLGGLAFMSPPLLFPGISNKVWILMFFGSVIVFFISVCLLGIWKGLKRYKY